MKRAAHRYGVLDPATVLGRLRQFAQPSEVAEPMELLRAGIIFHARGLVNAKSIQHNLDWVWPYWVERQFDPASKSFVPRAFSFSHINLTHRNWTAVGYPDISAYPIVDPRGLVTPLYDGWSLDFWIITDSGKRLLPSKAPDESVEQSLLLDPTLMVKTLSLQAGLQLELTTYMSRDLIQGPEVVTEIHADSDEDGWLAVAIRPYNPEGVQFIHQIQQIPSGCGVRVNREATVRFDAKPDSFRMAHYAEGDVYLGMPGSLAQKEVRCSVGMATGAALFRLGAGASRSVRVCTTLERDLPKASATPPPEVSWQDAMRDCAKLSIFDRKMQFLFDAAVRTVLLLSADELVPGPYTYRRFWFRDACLMLHPMLAIGLVERAERILSTFPARQTMAGYFLSQEGEWDSNGQVLWIFARYAELSGKPLPHGIELALEKAVGWLERKRMKEENAPAGTGGLLPAGFSAEHLGPNDYYYWDDFWGYAGLAGIGAYWAHKGEPGKAHRARSVADEMLASIEKSISSIPAQRAKGGIPAAPGRRMDAGAIGSMVADYPLQIYPPGDSRMLGTADFLLDRCFYRGGFFQEMIHSGINAYLTLDLAQTLLRAGDQRFAELIRRVSALASPTGQWPEAIHPQTFGGCMGDGQHGWAAAEWIMMIRNCFVREEAEGLVIGSGILPEWLCAGGEIAFGPTLTRWGKVTVRFDGSVIDIEADFVGAAPAIKIAVPGFQCVEAKAGETQIHLQK
ncbi:MAG: hypothetical protein ABI162_09115 [Luteolibacter sp.]